MEHLVLEQELSSSCGQISNPKDLHWLEKSVPCQHACPAGTDIPGYLEAIAAERFAEAYRINLMDNVFPAVLGRICTRPCEKACRHGFDGQGDPVAICFSKRSAADFTETERITVLPAIFPSSGKTVAVIGSGPSGLAAARDLSLLGHKISVYEKYHIPGGMLSQNIPPFRLPKNIVQKEIEQIRKQGVEINCSMSVGDNISFAELLTNHDALIVAGGCTRPHIPDISGLECEGVLHGSDFLRNLSEGNKKQVGDKVIVIGGGFTAVDCARAALRDGAKSVAIYYRRRTEDMTITPGEFEALEEEGIYVVSLVSPREILSRNGHISAIKFIRNTTTDATTQGGKAGIKVVENSEFEADADTLLLATGQSPDWSWINEAVKEQGEPERQLVDDELLPGTSIKKLFIAGDQAQGSTTVINAIASGKKCALAVDNYLTGQKRVSLALSISEGRALRRELSCNNILRHDMVSLSTNSRTLEAEVEQGFSREDALQEARRCYVCNYKYEIDTTRCIFCDLCCEVKPMEDCILKISGLQQDQEKRIHGYHFPDNSFAPENQFVYRINPAACIRCNQCLEVCPVSCIHVHKVSTEPFALPDEKLSGSESR